MGEIYERQIGTVLFVEDEVLIRICVADELRASGFYVIEAGSGEEALGFLHAATKIDALLTDILLGGKIDGYSVAAEFRKRHPQIKTIVASGTVLPNATNVDAAFISRTTSGGSSRGSTAFLLSDTSVSAAQPFSKLPRGAWQESRGGISAIN